MNKLKVKEVARRTVDGYFMCYHLEQLLSFPWADTLTMLPFDYVGEFFDIKLGERCEFYALFQENCEARVRQLIRIEGEGRMRRTMLAALRGITTE